MKHLIVHIFRVLTVYLIWHYTTIEVQFLYLFFIRSVKVSISMLPLTFVGGTINDLIILLVAEDFLKGFMI